MCTFRMWAKLINYYYTENTHSAKFYPRCLTDITVVSIGNPTLDSTGYIKAIIRAIVCNSLSHDVPNRYPVCTGIRVAGIWHGRYENPLISAISGLPGPQQYSIASRDERSQGENPDILAVMLTIVFISS